MKKRRILLAAVMMFLLLCGCAKAADEKNRTINIEKLSLEGLSNPEGNVYCTTDEKYGELAEKLMKEVTSKEFPGSIIVASDDGIIYASGTDKLQTDGQVVSPYTTYQIGSITKTYTSTCILKLAEEGKLSLDDNMKMYFPECEPIKDITIHQLLQMRSGIPDIVNFPDKAFHNRGNEFIAEMIAGTLDSEKLMDYLNDIVIDTEQADTFAYSNTNYLLLALIIEKVTGMSYNEYLHEYILEPLGMDSTTSGDIAGVTCAYTIADYPFHFEDNLPLMKGAGDITSNVLDMLQFDRALFGGALLNSESLNVMYDFNNGYSCGWMQDNVSSGLHGPGNLWQTCDEETIYHGGRTQNFVAYNIIQIVNGERIYVIMLFNDDEPTKESNLEINMRIWAVLKLL